MNKKTLICIGILVLMTAGSLAIPSAPADPKTPYLNELVRIDITHGMPKLPSTIDIAGGVPGQAIDIIIPKYQETILSGLSYTVLIPDVDAYSMQFAGQYHTFPQMEQILNATADNYPSITQLTSLGTTYQSRNIDCLEISSTPGIQDDKPQVLLMGLHHAREWPTIEICLRMISNLTTGYATNSTIHDFVDNNHIYIVPCQNPDGYVESHDNGDTMWRKNMQYFPQYGTTGVDTNRNYLGSVNGKGLGEWGTTYQGSCTHDPNDYQLYCGPYAGSEKENQAIMNFVNAHDIVASISWHTYSELVLWPWGYTTTHPDDSAVLSQIGTAMANMIASESGGGHYTPEQSDSLYPTTGDYLDWAYGNSCYELGHINFCYTIEACQQFQPPANHLDQVCYENCQAGLYLISQASTLSAVVPRVIPPVIDNMPDNDNGTYTVNWQEPNHKYAQTDAYQLDELTGLSTTIDDAESGSGNWAFDGFTISTQRAHSGTHSFKSHTADSQTSTMTTIMPLPVNAGTTVDYWTYYNTEAGFDYAYLEVSTDGRLFYMLANYSGTGNTWTERTCDLSDFVGKSVFLRFRYETDDGTTGEGFYVDDISPIAQFATITNISANLMQSHYTIKDQINGTYWYRVRGHNTARGWGDLSYLQSINVYITHHENDTTPPTLNITTPLPKHLYLGGKPILPFPANLIIGSITVEAMATDNSGVAHVDFSLDGTLMTADTTAPFDWVWSTPSFGRHTILVNAYDTLGNNATQSISVWKFF
jgi:hypothetical protein